MHAHKSRVWSIYTRSVYARAALDYFGSWRASRVSFIDFQPLFGHRLRLHAALDAMNHRAFLKAALKESRYLVHGGLEHIAKEGFMGLRGLSLARKIQSLSLAWHFLAPKKYIPYGFTFAYDVLLAALDWMELPPPQLSLGSQEERIGYYFDFNQQVLGWARQRGLSVPAVCALLYDLIPDFFAKVQPLPKPSNAWFVVAIGNKNNSQDPHFCENYQEGLDNLQLTKGQTAPIPWESSLQVKRGDVLVMYAAFHKTVVAVWRALTDAQPDPFGGYGGTVWLGEPVWLPTPLGLSELRQDPITGQNGFVRFPKGPAQGVMAAAEYNAMVKLMEPEVQQHLPLLPEAVYYTTDIQSEQDVETKLVEPNMEILGFTKERWQAKVAIRVGSGGKLTPDYLCDVDYRGRLPRARVVIEVKRTLARGSDFDEAFAQLLSYVNLVGAEVGVLASQEGLWVFTNSENGINKSDNLFATWPSLLDPSVQLQLRRLLHGLEIL